MIGMSLIAYNAGVTAARIRRGFEFTGLYPLSREVFFHHMGSKLTGIPGIVKESAATTVNAARAAVTQSVLGKQRLNIVDEPLLVATDA
jgi:hypothetical protein